MPLLADENVLIDPAQDRIVLPGCTVEEKGEINSNNKSPQPDEHEPLNTSEVVLPSICTKMKTAYRIIPPKPNYDWVKSFEEFDKARPDSEQLRDYLAKFEDVLLSDPASWDEYFSKLNEYFVKWYADVFADTLPERSPHPDSP